MFQSMFLNRKKQIDIEKSQNLIIRKHHNKSNRCLKRVLLTSQALYQKMKYVKKSAVLNLWCIFFHGFGIAVNAEP